MHKTLQSYISRTHARYGVQLCNIRQIDSFGFYSSGFVPCATTLQLLRTVCLSVYSHTIHYFLRRAGLSCISCWSRPSTVLKQTSSQTRITSTQRSLWTHAFQAYTARIVPLHGAEDRAKWGLHLSVSQTTYTHQLTVPFLYSLDTTSYVRMTATHAALRGWSRKESLRSLARKRGPWF
jgi:hypothetical protein